MPVMQRMTEYSQGDLGVETSSYISNFLSGRMYEERLNLTRSYVRTTPTRAKIHIICILKDFILQTIMNDISHQLHMYGSVQSAKRFVPFMGEIRTSMSRKEVEKKMRYIRYELNSLSDKIGKQRNEDVSFVSQKEYETKQREYNFLKDLKRRFQSISSSSLSKNGEQKNIQNVRKVVSLQKGYSQREGLMNIGPQLSSNIKQKLEDKFMNYCKKTSTVPSYFSEVAPESQIMKYKGFLAFTKQVGLDEALTFEERLRIFNRHSKFKKRVIFEQFYAVLEDFCRIICDKHKNKFTQHNFRLFLTNLLAKLEISFLTPQNHSIKKFQMHTGLFKQSIRDILNDGRKFLDRKRIGSIVSRKKLLARIKQPFPTINRSLSVKRPEISTTPVHKSVSIGPSISLKKIEPQCISYSSLMKHRKNNEKVQKLQIQSKRPQRKQDLNQKSLYQNLISTLVDMEQPDTLLQQILSKNYKR